MEAYTATESAITPTQAVAYLREKHNMGYSEEHLNRLARAGEAPSHKVGRKRMYRRSLLDAWALGEWSTEDASDRTTTEKAANEARERVLAGGA